MAMKKAADTFLRFLSGLVICVHLCGSVYSQAPERLSYQAVIRDYLNQLDTSAWVGMKISILQGSPSGTAVYVETQTAKTNENGLVSIEIGDGAVVSGSFASINWANGPYYALVETDPEGGNQYTITISSQLLSVPYALYAKKAGTAVESDPKFSTSLASGITAADTAYWNQKLNGGHFVGELYGGGVIFYVDRSGQHGMICAMESPPGYGQWSNLTVLIGQDGESDWNGQGNSNAIISQSGHVNSAAKDCDDYTNSDFGTGVFTDWYLPAIGQLLKLYVAFYEVNKVVEGDGNPATFPVYKTVYWTSTEQGENYAYYLDFINGNSGYSGKYNFMAVRAIRSF